MIPFWFRRRQRRHARALIRRPSIERALFIAALWIGALAALHVYAMTLFEGMPVFDAFWLTLTTLLTVGYGDLAAKTLEGRWATILLLYIGGIYTLANLASQWFEWRADARERKWRGLWRWRMQDHLLILNAPVERPEAYFERLVKQLRQTPRFGDCPVLIITRAFEQGLPDALATLGVAHCHAWGLDYEALGASAPQAARSVAILAKSDTDTTTDSITLDGIVRVRALSKDVPLVVECVDDRNRERMTQAGATAVVRPVRAYPEILARALAFPGTEKVLEELFNAEGAECARLDVSWSGTWNDVVTRLLAAEIGTAVAYESAQRAVVVNPHRHEHVSARAVFALVNGDVTAAQEKAREALRAP